MHPNGALIQQGFEAFAKGDMETIGRLFADDIVWHAAGTSPLSGDYTGKSAVIGMFGELNKATEGTFRQEIHAILADDDHVVVMTDNHQDKPTPYSGKTVFVWHVRDGKAAECFAVPVDQAGVAAAATG